MSGPSLDSSLPPLITFGSSWILKFSNPKYKREWINPTTDGSKWSLEIFGQCAAPYLNLSVCLSMCDRKVWVQSLTTLKGCRFWSLTPGWPQDSWFTSVLMYITSVLLYNCSKQSVCATSLDKNTVACSFLPGSKNDRKEGAAYVYKITFKHLPNLN